MNPMMQAQTADPVHDIFRSGPHPLDAIFNPKTVAVIGASEKIGSVGRTLLWNLITHPFGGTVYPVNLKRPQVLGIKAYPTIADVPSEVDLAVLVTPAQFVPGLIKECADAGVRGAIIISAGFKEMGPEGVELERQVMANKGTMRIIGPNCLGVMMPMTGLNATFAHGMARPGNVGFISQSGALCTAVLDWSLEHNVGFSAFMSIGSMVDCDWGDLIRYLGNDPKTQSIVIYMESVGNARSFLSAAREVAQKKPIIVIKAGRTEAAAKAAASHTGTLAGSDDVLEAAFRRSGVVRVNRISDLFYMAEAFAKQPLPQGPALTMITNAGGPGVLATDALVGTGGKLTELSDQTFEELNKILPAAWSRNNPVDVLGDAEPDRYAKALEICARDDNSDGMLVILTPQDMTDPTMTAEALKPYAKFENKPVLASWMGGAMVEAGRKILDQAGIPSFPYPDTAARVFNYMWQYSYNMKGIYETPSISTIIDEEEWDRQYVSNLITCIRSEGRTLLTENESKTLLSAYKIPSVPTHVAKTEDEAVDTADKFGYPVVIKLYSETITHKTDVGGVQLNLKDGDAVRGAWQLIESSVAEKVGKEHFLGVTVQPMIKLDGYELIIGSSIDPQFGPVLLFGSGGQLVEVLKDRSLSLPPLTNTLAHRMIEQTMCYKVLQGVRGQKGVNLDELEQIMVRFSQLVCENPWIKEIDINPLLASPDGFIALDARVVLHDLDTKEEDLPKLAIRPYPIQYVENVTLEDGTRTKFRPLRPNDKPLMMEFHERLSEHSVYSRFLQNLDFNKRTAHERLMQICYLDYEREISLGIIKRKEEDTSQREIIGVGRIRKIDGTNDADITLTIADAWQGKKLGSKLIERLVKAAREEGLDHLVAAYQKENKAMAKIFASLGFVECKDEGEEGICRVICDLKA